MGRTEIHAQDAVDQPSGEAHGNVTGQTAGTLRGNHVAELPAATAKSITPADDTDVAFTHRYLYVGGTAGNVAVRFESGGTAYVIPMPQYGLLPLQVHSVDSTSTTATGVWLFG